MAGVYHVKVEQMSAKLVVQEHYKCILLHNL